MAYNFLGLVNIVNRRLNEVELTDSNFASASGYYADAKESVNSAIKDINQQNFTWTWNYTGGNTTLSDNDVTIPYPADAKWVDFNTMRLVTPNETRHLREGDYEQIIQNYPDYEINPSDYASIPWGVYRRPDRKIGLHPPLETGGASGYSLRFDYYAVPSDLEAYSDVPTIPERYKYVITDGALMYSYTFRSDTENSVRYEERFNRGIQDMREIEMNRYEYLRSGMIIHPGVTQLTGYYR